MKEDSAMLNNRNTPEPGLPYARCLVCEKKLATEALAEEHMRSTMEPDPSEPRVRTRGHRIRIVQLTREKLVFQQIESILRSAIEACPGEIDLYSRELEITEDAMYYAIEEIEEAVVNGDFTSLHHLDFREAWRDVIPDEYFIPDGQLSLFDLAAA
jgi:hypothetical protein